MPDPADLDDVRPILERARRVAVIGAHPDPARPAHYVPAYLQAQGYDVRPVNAAKVGQSLFGHAVVASLDAVQGPLDVVDVFRRSEAVPDHLDEILAARPRVVWLQKGIVNDEVAAILRDAGITVVQDRCMLADHQALGLGDAG